jgi:hypothetical protein
MPLLNHLMLLALIATAPQNPLPGSHVIASCADWSITVDDFEHVLNTFPPERREILETQPDRRILVNEMVRMWTLTAEARKKGINLGTDYESRKAYYQNYINEIHSTITDDAVRKYYDTHQEEFLQVALSQILVLNGDSPIKPYAGVEGLPYKEAMKKALEIKAMLDKGADWDKVSKEFSQAIDIKDRGGAVGYIYKQQVTKSVGDAAFKLKIGEISDPIDSIYGLHILRISDKRVRPFDEIRDAIHGKMTIEEVNRRLDAKVKEAGVIIDESF